MIPPSLPSRRLRSATIRLFAFRTWAIDVLAYRPGTNMFPFWRKLGAL